MNATMRHARIIVAALLLVAGHAMAQPVASGKQTVSNASSLPATARDVDGTSVSRTVKDRFEHLVDHTSGFVNVKDAQPPYATGAKCDGSTDDTTALNAARDAAFASGAELVIPPGVCMTDGLKLKTGQRIRGVNWAGSSSGYFLALPATASVLKARSNTINVVEIDGDAGYVSSAEISHLGILGPNGNGPAATPTGVATQGNGIYIHGAAANGGNSGIHVHHVTIGGVGGKAIYAPLNWFSQYGPEIHVDNVGDNGIEISGGNNTQIIDAYAHRVASGKAAYRVYGSATITHCNGNDYTGGAPSGYWGRFGQSIALDGVLSVPNITIVGSNIEDNYGIVFNQGGGLTVDNTTFQAPANTTVTAIEFLTQPNKGNTLSSTVRFILKSGAAWSNGYAIHSPNSPFIMLGDNSGIAASYWNGASVAGMPLVTADANDGSFTVYPLKINASGTRVLIGTHKSTGTVTPGAIANGAAYSVDITAFPQISAPPTTFSGTGGNVCMPGFSADIKGCSISCAVKTTNTVTVTITNNTGAGVTIGSGAAWAYVLNVG